MGDGLWNFGKNEVIYFNHMHTLFMLKVPYTLLRNVANKGMIC